MLAPMLYLYWMGYQDMSNQFEHIHYLSHAWILIKLILGLFLCAKIASFDWGTEFSGHFSQIGWPI
jgi:hypothetical protein